MPTDLDARLAEWRKSLLDITKRNRLIKFVTGRIGGVAFVRPTAHELWQRLVCDGERMTFVSKRDLLGLPEELLNAESFSTDVDPATGKAEMSQEEIRRELEEISLREKQLKPLELLTDQSDRMLAARLLRLKRTSEEAQSDHGVTTLYAAFGFLKWFEDKDSQEEIRSPLLLMPVKLARDTVESPFTLTAEEDDILPNYCLAELLRTQFRITLPGAEYKLDPDDAECLQKYLAAVAEKVKDAPRWEVLEDAALGVFNFQKLAMWEDLGRNAERVKTHVLCRAIGGDNAVSVAAPTNLPTAEELDEVVPPTEVINILDADSSQQEAIEAVKRGAHLVMDGPPGTGKSQTISNMIAESLASGKTVLFVAEKTAALEVVKRRLDKCGLGDFCLELHSHKANKREVVQELGRCLELQPIASPDTASQLATLAECRRKLNEFVAELHAVRAPLGMSVFRVHGEVAKLDQLPGRSRIAIPDVLNKDAAYLQSVNETLSRLNDCKPVITNPKSHPWRGCKLTSFSQEAKDDARFHLNRLATAIPAAEQAVAALMGTGVAIETPSVPAWDAAVADARSLQPLPFFPAEWFARDPRASAQRAVDLYRAVVESRDLATKLPEFNIAAVKQTTDTAALNGANTDRERLTAGDSLSLGSRLAAIKRLIPVVRQLETLVGELDTAARAATQTLGLPRVPEVGKLAECARTAGVIARHGAGPRGWWEAGRRKELLTAVTRANEQERGAQATRTELITRFSPAAFAPESSAIARDAAHAGRSFWSRLFPRWWGLKKQVAAWYAGSPASGAELRADVAKLAEFHQNTDAARHVASYYDAELVKDTASSKVDLPASLEALQAVESLSSLGTRQDDLSRADRKMLGDNALSLEKAERAFRKRSTDAARDFVVPNLEAKSAPEVREWFANEATALEREATGLESLAKLLAPNQDVAGKRVREAAADVAKLASAAEQIRQLEVGEPTDEKQRSDRAILGEELIRFLDRWKRPITPELGAVLSERAARERVGAAIKQSETARGGNFTTAWEHITRDVFDPSVDVSTGVVLNSLPLADLAKWANERTADADRLFEWARFVQVERDITNAGVGGVLDEVRNGEFPYENAADAFRSRFFRLWLDAIQQKIPALGEFTTDTHERLIGRFSELDQLAIRTSADRVRAKLLGNANRPRSREDAPDASELGILLREVNKKRRHLPLRHLFAAMPTLLPRIKPCLMMSPLAVSTYLDNPEFKFDLVIFDEASQVRPHDAVCAIYRGKQLVVGGDPKQLPPTDFFNRSGEGEEGDEVTTDNGTAGFESLLDVCLSLGLCRKRLRWHYRSRREGLIAFSNRYFYEGTLVTFPSADEATTPAVKFIHVKDGVFKDGVNMIEAKRVAELVMEHARTTPQLSLGVIAFSQRQQERILDELEVLRRQNKESEEFFSADREDPFFVKNLENVQGDERDAMMMSVGYGPDSAGKVMMRFGPLNLQGGERRLNVAVTRSRRAMTIVSSMTANDVDLTRTNAEGAKLLKAFLDYAERGPVALATANEAAQLAADSLFEQEVGEELTRRGLKVRRQVGCGGYLVDIAIVDTASGKYLLGVECDGAMYRSAATARDRDRLRHSVLEGLGWRVIRVWSTDWVRDRAGQVNRVLAALNAPSPSATSQAAKEPIEVLPASNHSSAPETDSPKTKQKQKQKKQPEPDFDSIENVSEGELRECLLASLAEFGSMPPDDLISSVSKRLGFKRVGTKIRDRVASAINTLVAEQKVAMSDDNRVKVIEKE